MGPKKLQKPMEYGGFLKSVKEMAKLLPEQNEKWSFSTHSFRRAGAQLYYQMGIGLEKIMAFGRWTSSAIWLYLGDIPAWDFHKEVGV